MQGFRSHPRPAPYAMPDRYDDVSDDESDAVSVMSVSSKFAPSVATSATTADWEMRSASRPPSVFSMTSSLRANAFRHENGRRLNNYSDIYRLPADEEELDRLGMMTTSRVTQSASLTQHSRQAAHNVHGGHGQVPSPSSRSSRRGPVRRAQGCCRSGMRKWELVSPFP